MLKQYKGMTEATSFQKGTSWITMYEDFLFKKYAGEQLLVSFVRVIITEVSKHTYRITVKHRNIYSPVTNIHKKDIEYPKKGEQSPKDQLRDFLYAIPYLGQSDKLINDIVDRSIEKMINLASRVE